MGMAVPEGQHLVGVLENFYVADQWRLAALALVIRPENLQRNPQNFRPLMSGSVHTLSASADYLR